MTAETATVELEKRNPRGHFISDSLVLTKRNLLKYLRVPTLLIFSTVQPIMFVLLFVYVFGGAISIPGVSYTNFLMAGIFVQTSASPRPGAEESIEITLPDGGTQDMRGQVARRRAVPAHLRSITRGGVGVEFNAPPKAYLKLVEDLQRPRDGSESSVKAQKLQETPPTDLARKALLARLKQIRSEAS